MAAVDCQSLAQKTMTLSEQAFQNKDLLGSFTIADRGARDIFARGAIPNFRKNNTEDHAGCMKAMNQIFNHTSSISQKANAKP